MESHKSKIELDNGTEKGFGIVFAVFFLLLGLYPVMSGEEVNSWMLVIAVSFVVLAYFSPNLLVIPNMLWIKFGLALGAIIAPIVMALVYFLTVVPIGFIMKMIGKDLLGCKIDDSVRSYWIDRKNPIGPMSDQF